MLPVGQGLDYCRLRGRLCRRCRGSANATAVVVGRNCNVVASTVLLSDPWREASNDQLAEPGRGVSQPRAAVGRDAQDRVLTCVA
jgi:hypothetical protein